jgi:hypothetical protein
VDGDVRLIRWPLRLRGLSEDLYGLPFIPSTPTLASLPLVHLSVSNCKVERHERPIGTKSHPRRLDRYAHVPDCNCTVNYPSSG